MNINTKKWIDRFSDLWCDDRLEIAEAIARWIMVPENCATPNYDIEKAKEVKEFFENLVDKLTVEEHDGHVAELFEKYKNLTPERKRKIIRGVLSDISRYAKEQHQEDLENECARTHHLYGNWEYHEWETKEETRIDLQFCRVPVQHRQWECKCKRCGHVLVSETEPEEVRKARIIKENNARIRQLKKEMRDLRRG